MIDFDVVFKQSYERVLGHSTSRKNAFFNDFYDRFIAASPLVAEKFQHIDMHAQQVMLKQSIYYLLNLFSTKKIPETLADIARKHDHQHADVPPELYQLWLECLIETVAVFDPRFDDDVALAWRMVCSQGIAYMIFAYKKSHGGA